MAGLALKLWLLGGLALAIPQAQQNDSLQACGTARYHPSKYTCYESNFLCPVINGEPTLKCGNDCYRPEMYSCANGHLVYPPTSTVAMPSSAAYGSSTPSTPSSAPTCSSSATSLKLSDPPYENYFYSDCHVQAQVVVTSPQPTDNLTIIGPRLIVAWPAGNSGVCAFFAPQNGKNGSLGIELVNSTAGHALEPVYKTANASSKYPSVGVSGVIRLNSSAALTVPILGSIRTIRDFTEGPSILIPQIQNAIKFNAVQSGGASLTRLWLDNVTTTELTFIPMSGVGSGVTIDNRTLKFEAGDYIFYADYNYPQMMQLTPKQVLNPMSQGLIAQQPDQTTSLSFLSYTDKLLAGAWRFLTYFGRDSMIAALLLNPVLSEGQNSAMEAVIGAVLERINRTDGSVAHEETIGDYATYLNEKANMTSTAPQFDYKMIDSDYYLPVLMEQYFLKDVNGTGRASALLSTSAGMTDPANKGLTYADLALKNAQKIMSIAAPFAAPGNQTIENLAHLKEGQIVGEWRDSTYGIGGGRIPYDVNTALVPAALRNIAALSRAGIYANQSDWATLADTYAQVWEDSTLQFFRVTVPAPEARTRVATYVSRSNFPGPNATNTIDSEVIFHALALNGNNNLSQVQVMNTDDCFRLFLLNTTNQPQLTAFLNQTASNIRRPFPAGLLTPVGVLVANPAYGVQDVYATNWTTSAYHGTVVWSWQLAMLARGLELQLARCNGMQSPDFCSDVSVHSNVRMAYNTLWDTIEANSAHLSNEVWSWQYVNGGFQFTPLGALPPPPGSSATESDIRQLWSLTFLAVTSNAAFK